MPLSSHRQFDRALAFAADSVERTLDNLLPSGNEGEARLFETAIGIRFAALSTNRFVSVTAAQTLAVFRDTGAIPYLLTRLEDPSPGIRRAALSALQEITGNRDETRPDAWRAWAKRYNLDTIPEPAPSP